MKTRIPVSSLILLAVFAVTFCVDAQTAQGAWTEPVVITGLNDPNWHGGGNPCISSDQRTLFYYKNIPGAGTSYTTYLFEARREDPSGPFTSERVLTELNPGGMFILQPWISLDGQRLYYAVVIKRDGRFERVIKMAVQEGDSWVPTRTFWELQTEIVNTELTLTADELTILWGEKSGPEPLRYMQATRASIDEPFSNIREVPELTELGALGPHLSGDGLQVYFHLITEGLGNIYVASRASLDDPFGDIRLLKGVTGPDTYGYNPHLTPDERSIYFWSRRDGVGGIWVSRLILRPRIVAIENLEEAIKDKRAAIDRISASIKKELAVLMALHKMVMNPDGERLSRSDIYKARTQIMLALRRQTKSRVELQKAIEDLRQAIGHLRPDRPHPPEPDTSNRPDTNNKPGTGNKPQTDRPKRTGSSRR
ncbi:MAG: hypothetical protein KAT00_08400 [Planctomycetes bacterium]|nr:hypothetical protein [Planctomycetota bacterium]